MIPEATGGTGGRRLSCRFALPPFRCRHIQQMEKARKATHDDREAGRRTRASCRASVEPCDGRQSKQESSTADARGCTPMGRSPARSFTAKPARPGMAGRAPAVVAVPSACFSVHLRWNFLAYCAACRMVPERTAILTRQPEPHAPESDLADAPAVSPPPRYETSVRQPAPLPVPSPVH